MPLVTSLGVSAMVFLLIRQSVLGGVQVESSQAENIVNNAFMYANGWQEIYGTVFYTWGKYLYLLLIPHPLTIDYYPFHIDYVGIFSLKCLVPFLVFLIAGVLSIWGVFKKQKWAYGLVFFFVSFALVSNFLFIVGPFMGERLVFIPSLGFILFLIIILMEYLPKWSKNRISKSMVLIFIGLISIAFTAKTINRNSDWKDNFTLYTTDVKTSPKSAVINQSAALELLNKSNEFKGKRTYAKLRSEYLQQAWQYASYAVEVNETISALVLLGNIAFELEDYEKAIEIYEIVLNRNPSHESAYSNMLAALNKSGNRKIRLRGYQKLISINSTYESHYQLGKLWGMQFQQADSAIVHLSKAIELNQSSFEAYGDLGLAYAMKGNLDKSLELMLKSHEMNPSDRNTLINIGITYRNLGDETKAQEYFGKAEQLK